MKLNRNFITPFVASIFIMIGITGVLMFWHLLDGYTEFVHESMGLLFVVVAVMHVLVNWKSLKSHLRKTVLLPVALAVMTTAAGLLTVQQLFFVRVDDMVIERVLSAPIKESFHLLGIEYTTASGKLENKGIHIGEALTIEEIWQVNQVDPQEVMELLLVPNGTTIQ